MEKRIENVERVCTQSNDTYIYISMENVDENLDLLFFFHPLLAGDLCFAYKLRGIEHARTYRQSSDHQERESERR